MQLHENTEATRIQSEYALNAAMSSGELACMGDTFADAMSTAILKPSQLTQAQVYQVWCYVNVPINAARDTWIAHREGRASQATWETAKDDLVDYLDFDVGKVIWSDIKSNFGFPPQAVDEIDKALAQGHGRLEQQFGAMVTDVQNRFRPGDNASASHSPELTEDVDSPRALLLQQSEQLGSTFARRGSKCIWEVIYAIPNHQAEGTR